MEWNERELYNIELPMLLSRSPMSPCRPGVQEREEHEESEESEERRTADGGATKGQRDMKRGQDDRNECKKRFCLHLAILRVYVERRSKEARAADSQPKKRQQRGLRMCVQ
jgi:hypothetical protein